MWSCGSWHVDFCVRFRGSHSSESGSGAALDNMEARGQQMFESVNVPDWNR